MGRCALAQAMRPLLVYATAPTGRRADASLGLPPTSREGPDMLYTIAVILLILWVLGLVSSYTIGGFIHILLVVAIVMILVNLISGRKAL
jgi:hypothetical protein